MNIALSDVPSLAAVLAAAYSSGLIGAMAESPVQPPTLRCAAALTHVRARTCSTSSKPSV